MAGYREEQQDNAYLKRQNPGDGCSVGKTSAYPDRLRIPVVASGSA